MNKKYLDIIDPIHDFVRIYGTEIEVIDNPIFQRLRRIRQLSGAHLVYPGAQHTRFEHSLGVMHIAGQAGQALEEKGIISSEDTENLRISSLLHDIGHGPFSHLFEEVLQKKKKISHEYIGKEIITKTELGDVLTKGGFDKKHLTNLAFGNSKSQFMNEIISGALSSDMMDYLLRDGYFTGAEHAKIDHKRITKSLEVYRKKLALEKSALYSFESMMHSRYQMFKAVYFHKTVRSAEVMLLEAMSLAYEELGLSSDIEDYIKLTDDYLLAKLLSIKPTSNQLLQAKTLAENYQNRKLYKCVFERIVSKRESLGESKITRIRNNISEKAKIKAEEIFVDSSTTPSIPLTPAKKESQSIILITKGKKRAKEIPISNLPLVSPLSGFMNILRVYTNQRNRKKVEIAAKTILGG